MVDFRMDPALTTARAQGSDDASRQAVLVVDDEPDIREALAAILDAYLPEVMTDTASSGAEALKMLEERPFDLIITDFRMAGMDGLEFLQAAQAVAPKTPRIMITAYPDIDLAIRALNEEHISNFLPKPLSRGVVVEAVVQALAERRTERARIDGLISALQAMRSPATMENGGIDHETP